METKANYVAVGAFVLSCLVALFVMVMWLAGSQYANEFAVYRTYFEGSVTGLGTGTTVRYNGIEVGNVRDVNFDPTDPRRVIADLQIDPELRLRQDSVVSLEMQGMTGGIYVQITGGTPDAPFLVTLEGQDYPIIPSRQSAIQLLFESTPELLTQLSSLTESGSDLLNAENRAALAETFANLRDITETINGRSQDIDQALANLAPAVERLNAFLANADATLTQLGTVAVSADQTAQTITQLVTSFDQNITQRTVPQIDQLLIEARALVFSLSRLSEAVERQPTQLLFGDRREGYAPQ
jgi:phospholipid/cholesterol/gamma-HCH transport system substrate-binding protein